MFVAFFFYRETQQKFLKRDQYRNDLEQLRRTQETFRERNRREIEEENERIAVYLKERDERQTSIREIELEKRRKDDELRDRMCSALNEIEVNVYFCQQSMLQHDMSRYAIIVC